MTRPRSFKWFLLSVAVLTTFLGLRGDTPSVSATASSADLTLLPSATVAASGVEIDVAVQINSGTTLVNAAQAQFTYPPALLSPLGFDDGGSKFNVTGQETASNGIVQIAKAITGGGGISGPTLVTEVRFTTNGTGTAELCQSDASTISNARTNATIPLIGGSTSITIGSPSSFDLACAHKNFISRGASNVAIAFAGHGFDTSSTLQATASGTGVSITHGHVNSAISATALVSVSTAATIGLRNLVLTNGSQSFTCVSCLSVGAGPIAQSATPSSIARGATGVTVRIRGLSFGRMTRVSINGATVTGTRWVSYSEVDVVVTVPTSAGIAYAPVTVYDPFDGTFGFFGRGRCNTCLRFS